MTRRPGWGAGVMTRRELPMGTGTAEDSTGLHPDLDFELDGVTFKFLGIDSWRHAGRPLPRVVLRFQAACGRCYTTFAVNVSQLTAKRLRAAIARHKCRPLPFAVEEPPTFETEALEARIRDAQFRSNEAAHGPIDPALPEPVRRETAELYCTHTPGQIAEIRARYAEIRRREVGG